jgi:hypothetical protein
MRNLKLSIQDHIQVLEETIKWYEAQLQPYDCGWMHTTISGIKNRIADLKKQLPPRPNIHL